MQAASLLSRQEVGAPDDFADSDSGAGANNTSKTNVYHHIIIAL